MSADSLLAQRSAGAGGLDNGDLDDILASGASLSAQGLFLYFNVGGGYLDHSLLGLANRSSLKARGDDLPVHTSWALEALLGECGLGVRVWDSHWLGDNGFLLNHGSWTATLFVSRVSISAGGWGGVYYTAAT